MRVNINLSSIIWFLTCFPALAKNYAGVQLCDIHCPGPLHCHLHWFVFLCHSKLQNLAETRYPVRKTNTFFGSLKDCVLLKTTIGEQLQRIYNEHSVISYVGNFSSDQPRFFNSWPGTSEEYSGEGLTELRWSRCDIQREGWSLVVKGLVCDGERWRQVRSRVTPVFTSGKMKMLLHLVEPLLESGVGWR